MGTALSNGFIYPVVKYNNYASKENYWQLKLKRATSSAYQLIYESDSYANESSKFILPRLIISFNKNDYTFNSASINTELGIPANAEGLSVRAALSVTGAASTVGANLQYIKNNYTLKSELPTESIPTISSGDAGKVLTVNSTEDGVEWAAASGGSSFTPTSNLLLSWNGSAASNVLGVGIVVGATENVFNTSGTISDFTTHEITVDVHGEDLNNYVQDVSHVLVGVGSTDYYFYVRQQDLHDLTVSASYGADATLSFVYDDSGDNWTITANINDWTGSTTDVNYGLAVYAQGEPALSGKLEEGILPHTYTETFTVENTSSEEDEEQVWHDYADRAIVAYDSVRVESTDNDNTDSYAQMYPGGIDFGAKDSNGALKECQLYFDADTGKLKVNINGTDYEVSLTPIA